MALVTTDRVVAEARRRIDFGLKRPELQPIVGALIAGMTVFPVAALSALLPQAEIAFTDTVARRNGSISDAHVLTLAWNVDADVWTTDRDFAGTRMASWSAPNLIRAVTEARRAPIQAKRRSTLAARRKPGWRRGTRRGSPSGSPSSSRGHARGGRSGACSPRARPK